MRLLFEISNLKTATPATVSRAGILFLNPADLGWNPILTSWIDTREVHSERANMMILVEKYIPPCLEALRTGSEIIDFLLVLIPRIFGFFGQYDFGTMAELNSRLLLQSQTLLIFICSATYWKVL